MQRILFVCTGNTCRSPMAEAILKNHKLEDVEVRSAGVHAVNGSGASAHTKSVLQENNIPHDHQSRVLSESDITWATYVLTMTASHKEVIIHHFPLAVNKTFTLKEFAGETFEHDVADPFGGSSTHYREAYQEIEQAIRTIMGRLNKENNR